MIEFANKILEEFKEHKSCYELDKQWLLLYQLYLDGKIGNPYSKEDAAFKTFEILKKYNVTFIRHINEIFIKPPEDTAFVKEAI